MRFVLVSFLFMGWAFYELSGGADFEPRGLRATPQQAAAPEPRKPRVQDDMTVQAASLVASPAIAPRIAPRPAADPTRPTRSREAARQEAAARAAERAQQARLERFNQLQGLTLASITPGEPDNTIRAATADDAAAVQTPAAVPSLADYATRPEVGRASTDLTAPTGLAPAAEPAPDLRQIKGSRVNIRNGPGTRYPVLRQLLHGHEVEVLGDPVDGWRKLRTEDGQVGWIAEFLLTEPSG